jgi:hypothetical protein
MTSVSLKSAQRILRLRQQRDEQIALGLAEEDRQQRRRVDDHAPRLTTGDRRRRSQGSRED